MAIAAMAIVVDDSNTDVSLRTTTRQLLEDRRNVPDLLVCLPRRFNETRRAQPSDVAPNELEEQ